MEDIIASTVGLEGPDPSIRIETQRGSYVVTPKYISESEECSWEIKAGKTEGMSVNPAARGETQQRLFHATCRFTDGKAYIFHWKW